MDNSKETIKKAADVCGKYANDGKLTKNRANSAVKVNSVAKIAFYWDCSASLLNRECVRLGYKFLNL